MRKIQTYLKLIESRCQLIASSPEADRHSELKSVASSIFASITARDGFRIEVMQEQKRLRDSKNSEKAQLDTLVRLAVEGNMMLESVKLPSEVDKKKVRIRTRLSAMSSSKLLEECILISATLQKQRQQLLDYGYTREQVSQLSYAIGQHNSHQKKLLDGMLAYTTIRNTRNCNDQLILEMFDKINHIVETNMVLMPNLYSDYFKLKLPSYRKAMPSVAVVVTYNGNPAAGAQVVLYGPPVLRKRKGNVTEAGGDAATKKEVAIYNKLTNAHGEVNTGRLKPNAYHLMASKNGYEEQHLQIYVNPREVTRVFIELVPYSNNPCAK
jgi:hypothetical protein